jgi:rRNA-processing protein FCF1
MIRDPLRSPVNIAIDTNLLLILIGYRCLLLDNARAPERTRVLTAIRGRDDGMSPERFDDLWNLFHNAASRIVTQHVVAETYGLRNRLAKFSHRKDLVWRSALDLLTHPGIEEHTSCPVRDMHDMHEYRDILYEIGPTDAGLIHTAEREKATIITDDGQLTHWAAARSVPGVLLNQIGLR